MVLSSRIHLAIGIDRLGHQSFFEEVFSSMELHGIQENPRDLLRIETDVEKERVWQNVFWTSKGEEKEADKAKRLDDRRDQENGVIGRKGRPGYSSGIRMRGGGKNGDSEEKKSNKKARTGEPNNNQLTQCTAKRNASVEATTTSEYHRQDAHGRGFRRWKWPGIMRRE
jgi:hypothetical protein